MRTNGGVFFLVQKNGPEIYAICSSIIKWKKCYARICGMNGAHTRTLLLCQFYNDEKMLIVQILLVMIFLVMFIEA